MTEYEITIKNDYFNNIIEGKKKSIIVKNVKDYQVGDIIILSEIEYDAKKTGDEVYLKITHIHTGVGMLDNYADLSISIEEVVKKDG